MARVTGAFGIVEDSRAARLLVTAAAPVVVNQPVDVQVVAGQVARFAAASTSGVAQTLQWQRNSNGGPFVDLVNETATALAFTTAAGDDGTRLRMCATNSGGTTCTRAALLSVIAQPVTPAITQQPQPVSTAAGSSANFTVRATGGSLSYAWEQGRDGTTFSAHPTCGDAATCTLSNTTLADDGTFLRVRVFNGAGSVTSNNALLTVRLNPGAALTRLGAGGGHSIGLRANAALRAWGRNFSGQLGDGTTDMRNGAVDVAGLSDVATFSVGFDHVLAIRANGEVWAWGENRDGQLGDGTTVDRPRPQPVPGLGAARAVAAGMEGANTFSLAVAADGTVWSWGDNSYGQLGDGTVNDRLSPGPVASLTEIVSVAGGSRHALALRRDGTVWAWGANNVGQLGNGTTTASLVPTPIALPAPIVAIATGSHSSLALSDTGAVFAWGHNVSGQLGDGTTTQRLAPVSIALPAPVIALSAGWDGHALTLLLDGRVFAWGFNEYGQLGLGTDTPFEATPMQVIAPLPADIVAIGAGANHSLALDAAGNVWAWGNNGVRQLGDGTTEPQRPTPVQVFGVNLN
jgi:alpha-tubulin suppressor-like RCC1 family protein